MDLKSVKRRGRISTLRYWDCNSLSKCSACQTGYQKSSWGTQALKDSQRRGSALVCKDCRGKGCTADDIRLYPCTRCAREFGTTRFDKQVLKDLRDHGRSMLTCKECSTARAAREKALHAQLRKSKRVCKCFCLYHKDACPLSPCVYGEKRWPGSDGHITADDRAFLDNLRPRPAWWLKAWGKTFAG